MLLTSDMVDIVWSLAGAVPPWLIEMKLGWLAIFLVACLAGRRLRPLWPFGLMRLVVKRAEWANAVGWWRLWFGGDHPRYAIGQLGIQVGELASMAVEFAAFGLV